MLTLSTFIRQKFEVRSGRSLDFSRQPRTKLPNISNKGHLLRHRLGWTWISLIVLLTVSCASQNPDQPVTSPTSVPIADLPIMNPEADAFKPASNIILFVAQGAGLQHVEATSFWQHGSSETLALENTEYLSELNAEASGGTEPDRAASGSAIATGLLGRSGTLSLDVRQKPLETILELAASTGRRTGIVTTTSVTGPGIAAFYAHTQDHNNRDRIAESLIESGIDVVLGGGLQDFLGEESVSPIHGPKKCVSNRRDGADFLRVAEESGYRVSLEQSELPGISEHPVLGLYACAQLSAPETDFDSQPDLADLTSAALRMLENENGFMLIVDAGTIDSAALRWDGPGLLSKLSDLDDGVKRALDFAQSHEDTLVIATGAHESGFLNLLTKDAARGTLSREHQGYRSLAPGAEPFDLVWGSHERSLRPTFIAASGPAAVLTEDITHTSGINVVIQRAMGIPAVPGAHAIASPTAASGGSLDLVTVRETNPDCNSAVSPHPNSSRKLEPVESGVLRIGLAGGGQIWVTNSISESSANATRIDRVHKLFVAQNVDLAVWLGGDVQLCYADQIRVFSELTSGGNLPLRKLTAFQELRSSEPYEFKLQRFQNLFGHAPFGFVDIDGYRLLFISDESSDEFSYLSEDQVAAISSAVNNSDEPVVVFSTHNLPLRPEENQSDLIGAGSRNTAAIANIFEKADAPVLWISQRSSGTQDRPQELGDLVYFSPKNVGLQTFDIADHPLLASLLTLRQRRIVIDTFDTATGELISTYRYAVERDN